MLWILFYLLGELLAIAVPFTALLAAYLYFRREVQSLGAIMGFVAEGCGSFIVALLALQYGRFLPAVFPIPGSSQMFYAGCLGGGLVSMAFLILLPGRVSSSRFTREMLISIAAAGLLGPLAFALLGPDISKSPSPDLRILLIWQSGMAITLVMIGELRGAATEDPPTVADVPMALRLGGDHTFLLAMCGLLVAVAAWLIVMQVLMLH